jgi:hypothetical protein
VGKTVSDRVAAVSRRRRGLLTATMRHCAEPRARRGRSEDSMRRFLISLILVVSAAAVHAQDYSDPIKLITSIYRTYTPNNLQAGFPHVYSSRLQALIDADAKNTPEGDSGKIDWDVFVNGQDWKISKLKVTLVRRAAARAQVRARFNNFKQPEAMIFDLVREKSGWRIDDIGSLQNGARWTMSKILMGAPDAFPDENK